MFSKESSTAAGSIYFLTNVTSLTYSTVIIVTYVPLYGNTLSKPSLASIEKALLTGVILTFSSLAILDSTKACPGVMAFVTIAFLIVSQTLSLTLRVPISNESEFEILIVYTSLTRVY